MFCLAEAFYDNGQDETMHQYLEATGYIDWRHPAVLAKAGELAKEGRDLTEVAKRCFEFVRDEIKHSWDHRLNPGGRGGRC